jgi:Xaa-Pro aminopeptidase
MDIFKKADTLVLTTSEDRVDENFYYLAGISKTKHVSAAVVAKKTGRLILTNRLEYATFGGRKAIIKGKDQFEKTLRKTAGEKIGMNLDYLSANGLARYKKIFRGREIIDVSKELGEMRGIKSNSEIAKIKQACKTTIDVLDDIEKFARNSRTEKELALALDTAAVKSGAECVAYPTIVASGRNAALPHHSSDKTKIGKGILLIDFGAIYDGYCADITRTFFAGKADSKSKQIYNIVYAAQQAGLKKMISGGKASAPHIAAEEIIKKGLKQKIIHSFGHGLGIQVHDYPGSLGPKSSFIMKNNMVFTAEPGYYNKTWGGVRIEDDIAIGRGSLTRAPNFLKEI